MILGLSLRIWHCRCLYRPMFNSHGMYFHIIYIYARFFLFLSSGTHCIGAHTGLFRALASYTAPHAGLRNKTTNENEKSQRKSENHPRLHIVCPGDSTVESATSGRQRGKQRPEAPQNRHENGKSGPLRKNGKTCFRGVGTWHWRRRLALHSHDFRGRSTRISP